MLVGGLSAAPRAMIAGFRQRHGKGTSCMAGE
jgi:hypothetical protein